MKHINGYDKGLNQDLSPKLYDNRHYLNAEWLTPVINEEGKVGTMTNPKGTVAKINLPVGQTLIGETKFRDVSILISNENGDTYIYKFTDDGTTSSQAPGSANFVQLYTDEPLDTEYKLGYTESTKLSIVSRYENDNVQTIYFSDQGNEFPLRYLNIEDTTTGYTASDFNIIPNVTLSKPEIIGYTSGNLTSGKIAYSYQQYKKYGAETSFSELSKITPISSTVNNTYLKDIKGSDIGENCGVGVELKIEDLDYNFDRTRVLAFYYSDYDADPTIRIIYEGANEGNDLYLVDNGQSLGSYDLSTFRTFNQFFIKPSFLATKSNMLFAGKIKEEYFDLDLYLENDGTQDDILTTDATTGKKFWDSRVFRYRTSDDTAKVYNSALDSIITVNGTYSNVPYNHDCVNHYNLVSKNIYYSTNPTLAYRFQSNGSTVGGEGKNIDLTFSTRLVSNGETRAGYGIDGTKPEEWRDLGYQRDEIYRQSIQFEDYLGRKSYPKWMLDVRMPNHDDSEFDTSATGLFAYCNGSASASDESMYTQSLYPAYKVSNVPKNPDGSHMKWRILRVEREGYDKTVLSTALMGGTITHTYDNTTTHGCFELTNDREYRVGAWTSPGDDLIDTIDRQLVELISPEIAFDNLNLSNTEIRLVGALDTWGPGAYWYRQGDVDPGDEVSGEWFQWDGNQDFESKTKSWQIIRKFSMFRGDEYTTNTTPTNKYAKIIDHKIIKATTKQQSVNSIGGRVYRHMNLIKWGDSSEEGWAEHGTSAIVELNKPINIHSNDISTYGRYMFVLIKKDTIPYNGNSFYARETNTYIPSGVFESGSSTDYQAAEWGDTYIAMFDYMRSQMPSTESDLGTSGNYQEIIYFPVETQINLKLRSDDSFSKISDVPFYVNANLREDGLFNEASGIAISKLYQYNNAYSRENDAEVFVPLSIEGSNVYYYDHRIRRSQIKFDGEYSNSWLKFLPNDYLDVDAQYGELTKLEIFNDKLLYFQPNGFGHVPVGEKELIPSSTSASLSLGSSGILNRYDYLSNTIGADSEGSILVTPNGLYIYSTVYNSMYKFTGKAEPLQDMKGMNSWFDDNVNSDSEIISGYNPLMSEVLFAFNNSVLGNKVIVFNELNNSFVYTYPETFTGGISRFITHNNNFYSFNNTINTKVGHKHNVGDRGMIHSYRYPSSITILVNPQGGTTNIYDVLELVTDHYDSSGTELQSTFTSVEVSNDYQTTGEITLVPGNNIKQRFRVWRFRKLRANTTGDPKIKSGYIKVKLNYTNAANAQIILHNLITNFSPSKMTY